MMYDLVTKSHPPFIAWPKDMLLDVIHARLRRGGDSGPMALEIRDTLLRKN